MTQGELQAQSPSELIQKLLEDRGWNQRSLALALRVQPAVINRLVLGKRPVDARSALLLSEAFGVPAERFLELQSAVDLEEARKERHTDPETAVRARVFSMLPIAEMMTRGWIKSSSMHDTDALEHELLQYFGVSKLEDIQAPHHAAKKTNVGREITPAQLAWVFRVQRIAREMIVPRYSPSAVRDAVNKLKELRQHVSDARLAPRILAECGVRFVVVEALTSAKIDGVCLWLNDMSPVIGVTLRHDRIDNFWFVLRHEIEHVLRGHGRESPIVDVDLNSATGEPVHEEERVANSAASDFCVPGSQMERFYTVKEPYFAERDILGFAATMKVHPGLVVGQLQHRSGRFDRFRNHLAKVRGQVLPEAVADGWGAQYPLEYETESA